MACRIPLLTHAVANREITPMCLVGPLHTTYGKFGRAFSPIPHFAIGLRRPNNRREAMWRRCALEVPIALTRIKI